MKTYNLRYIIFIVILLILFFVGFFIYKCFYVNKVNNNKKLCEHMINTTVVLFKTHTWNDNIEFFVKKIKNETIPNRIDFYILMHSDDHKLINHIKDKNLKKYVLVFSESDIKRTYQKGFYSMWLSNHWILM